MNAKLFVCSFFAAIFLSASASVSERYKTPGIIREAGAPLKNQ